MMTSLFRKVILRRYIYLYFFSKAIFKNSWIWKEEALKEVPACFQVMIESPICNWILASRGETKAKARYPLAFLRGNGHEEIKILDRWWIRLPTWILIRNTNVRLLNEYSLRGDKPRPLSSLKFDTKDKPKIIEYLLRGDKPRPRSSLNLSSFTPIYSV